MTPEIVLGPAMLEAVREVVRAELQASASAASSPARLSGTRGPWVTPPAASRATGVPLKTIREFIKAGTVKARLRNRGANPAQRKYLVNVDEVAAAAENRARGPIAIPSDSEPGGAIDLAARAERLRAKAAGGNQS